MYPLQYDFVPEVYPDTKMKNHLESLTFSSQINYLHFYHQFSTMITMDTENINLLENNF